MIKHTKDDIDIITYSLKKTKEYEAFKKQIDRLRKGEELTVTSKLWLECNEVHIFHRGMLEIQAKKKQLEKEFKRFIKESESWIFKEVRNRPLYAKEKKGLIVEMTDQIWMRLFC